MSEEERKPVPEWLKKSLEQAAGPDYEPAHTEEEARVDYQGGLNDFLDQAYRRQEPADARIGALEGGGPGAGITSIEEYLANVRVTKEEFGDDAFALLMNPVDYAKLEMLMGEVRQVPAWDRDRDAPLLFASLLCQQAMFIAEGHYTILDKPTYEKLVELNPETL